MATRWHLKPFDSDRINELSRSTPVPPLIAQLLINRGVDTAASAREFLDNRLSALHDPESLPGVVEAAERLRTAILNNRKIVVYGDYDVDGVCGTSLLWACLKLAGARQVDYYIPHRLDEGYGLNEEALKTLAQNGAEVVVTVDCGISAIREAEVARELGLELIITDHHHIGPDLPAADVLVHPGLPGSTYPFPELCGCGVALKLAWQVAKSFGDGKKSSPHLRDFLLNSIMLVAMATVADVMPLAGENRLFVAHGLKGMGKAPTIGLQALLEVSGVDTRRRLNTGQIGFKLAPRINAAGRLERAMMAVEMLTTDDIEVARQIAQKLDECNSERQQVELTMLREARQMVDEGPNTRDQGAIVVGKDGWHPGVIGIVASRLVDAFHRPTIVIAIRDDVGQGSARSVPGFHLYDAIAACSEGLIRFGGHSAAAGLKLPAALVPEFTERFNAYCKTTLTEEQRHKVLTIDAETTLTQLDERTVESIDRLEPFGQGNPKPLVQVNRVKVIGDPRFMTEDKHVKIRVAQGSSTPITAVGFGMGERGKGLKAGMLLDLVGTPSINEYFGRREVQIELRDFRPSGVEHADP